MKPRQVVALIAGIALIIGPFCPIVSFPIVGDMTYFKNGEGDGTIVVALGVVTLILGAMRMYILLWLTGVGSVGMATYTFLQIRHKIGELSSSISGDLKDNPFRGLADVAVQAVQIKWGLGVVIVGGVLAMAAAAMSDESGD